MQLLETVTTDYAGVVENGHAGLLICIFEILHIIAALLPPVNTQRRPHRTARLHLAGVCSAPLHLLGTPIGKPVRLPEATCVDQDGISFVSIAEVQKVINYSGRGWGGRGKGVWQRGVVITLTRPSGFSTRSRHAQCRKNDKKSPCISTGALGFCCARRSARQAKYCNLLCSVIQDEYEI